MTTVACWSSSQVPLNASGQPVYDNVASMAWDIFDRPPESAAERLLSLPEHLRVLFLSRLQDHTPSLHMGPLADRLNGMAPDSEYEYWARRCEAWKAAGLTGDEAVVIDYEDQLQAGYWGIARVSGVRAAIDMLAEAQQGIDPEGQAGHLSSVDLSRAQQLALAGGVHDYTVAHAWDQIAHNATCARLRVIGLAWQQVFGRWPDIVNYGTQFEVLTGPVNRHLTPVGVVGEIESPRLYLDANQPAFPDDYAALLASQYNPSGGRSWPWVSPGMRRDVGSGAYFLPDAADSVLIDGVLDRSPELVIAWCDNRRASRAQQWAAVSSLANAINLRSVA